MVEHFKSLEYALRTYRKRVCGVLQYIAVNKVPDTLVVICVNGVHILVRCSSECKSALLDGFFLLCRETAGVDHYGVYFVTFFLEVRDTE